MADTYFDETAEWQDSIRMVKNGDPIDGGETGPVNLMGQGLANRSKYLLAKCDALEKELAVFNGTSEAYESLKREVDALKSYSTTASIKYKLDHLDRLIGNLYVQFQDEGLDPDGYDNAVFETFSGSADEIDQTVATVTSIVSGDNSIDVGDSSNLIIGSHYQLSDGESIEEVQIASIAVSEGTHRVKLMENVKNQYSKGRVKLYRSSVAIYDGKAYGGGGKQTDTWDANTTFEGALTPQDLVATFDATNTALTQDGTLVVEDGQLILGSPVVGVALVTEGGGNGEWAQVDEEGDDLSA